MDISVKKLKEDAILPTRGSEYAAGIYYEEFLRPEVQKALVYTGITRFKQSMIYVKKTKKYY